MGNKRKIKRMSNNDDNHHNYLYRIPDDNHMTNSESELPLSPSIESVEPLEPLLDRRMGCVTLQRRSGIAGGLEATENSPGGVKDAAGMGGAMAEG